MWGSISHYKAHHSSLGGDNYASLPQEDISNTECCHFINILTQLVASQCLQTDHVGPVVSSSKVTRVGRFNKLTLPTFIGSMV